MDIGHILLHGERGSFHSGIDLVGDVGSHALCVKEGQVTWAGWQGGYGNCIEIKHIDEQGNAFYSFYGHMRKMVS